MKLLLIIFVVVIVVLSAGCVVRDETMYIAGDIVTINVRDNRPRVRVSTGLDECKWRAKGNLNSEDYAVHIECKVNTDVLKFY